MAKNTVIPQLGDMIYKRRVAQRGYTSVQAAQDLGISFSYYSKLENGLATPSLPIFQRLCQWLPASADELLGLPQKDYHEHYFG